MCCYPLCSSRKAGAPAQITRANMVDSTNSGAWTDLARVHPKIFNTTKGRVACEAGSTWLHERCATALRRTRPAPGMNLCESASYHYHFLIPNIALLLRVCRASTGRSAHADRCPRTLGVVTGHHERVARTVNPRRRTWLRCAKKAAAARLAVLGCYAAKQRIVRRAVDSSCVGRSNNDLGPSPSARTVTDQCSTVPWCLAESQIHHVSMRQRRASRGSKMRRTAYRAHTVFAYFAAESSR